MKIRILASGIAVAVMVAGLAACSAEPASTGSSDSAGGNDGVTLDYWATNQGTSLDNDKEILTPELKKFTEQTGIKVNLEVVPWTDMTNNTLAAAVSGQGPDVVNIGNTNATTYQTTGAFTPFDQKALDAIGGKDRFVESAFETAGPAGSDPTSIPLYGQVYGLFYNKKLFADAGLTPPTTWEDLVTDAKQLTKEGQWGMVAPAGTVNVSMHMAFIFTAQNGGSPFDKDGKPDFTSDAMVKGVKQYLDLMTEDKVINPSTIEYTDGTKAAVDFAKGNIGMYMAQTGGTSALAQNGMTPDQYGVVPIPSPTGGDKIGSFVAGSNISIFKSSKHQEAALELVKFLTSDEEQLTLNKAYGTLPVVKGVEAAAFADDPDKLKVWSEILSDYAKPLPLVSTVSAFQTNVGGAVVALFAKSASGTPISEADIKAALSEAQDKMAVAG
jgi:multiple sugar transport system substrate-binding protein